MPYDIKYVIPSYKRIDTLKEKTISLLERYQIPSEAIYIFTAPEEFEAYQTAFPKCNVIKGELGLRAQRNYITLFFKEGTPLVCLDDDLESLWCLNPADPKSLYELEDLKVAMDGAFLMTEAHKLSLWGVYPIKNAFFMKPGHSTDLKFCIGHMWGCFNRHDIQITLDYKEDYERTLRFYKRDGGVVRLNWICAKTRMYQPGGMGLKEKERLVHNMESCKKLADMFPGLMRTNKRREGEIILSNPKKDNGTSRVERRATQTPKRTPRGLKDVESPSNDNKT